MKKLLLFCCFLSFMGQLQAQEGIYGKWQGTLSLGQYAASLAVPKLIPIRAGIQAGAIYQWNDNKKHQFTQSANLAYFYHRNLQHAVQLYTEGGYQIHLENGLQINPFSIGGGYVASVGDMDSYIWNTETNKYEATGRDFRNNWMISLGFGLGYETDIEIAERPVTFYLNYRLQVQGIIVKENVPVMAYSPIMFGISLPI